MRRYSGLLLALLALSLCSTLVPTVSQSGVFYVETTSFRSYVGGDVYPGSTSARLEVGVKYLGTEVARSVYGCLQLPEGFSARSSCAGARGPDGGFIASVEYGEIVYFVFVVDVGREVSPGTYIASLNVTARIGATLVLVSEVSEISLTVSPYPELRLELVDSYWSPEAYPGTAGTTLYLVFRLGGATMDSATVVVELPEGFYPRTSRRTVGSVRKHTTFTVAVPGISVSRHVAPGAYRVSVRMNSTAVTDDGVYYSAAVSLEARVPVGDPPQLLVRLVNSGWTGSRVPYGSKAADYRVVLRLEDSATVSSLVAVLRLPACAVSSDGSSSIVVYSNRPVTYGEVFELVFGGITFSCRSTEFAELSLEVLAVKDGSEFWSTLRYLVPLVVQNPAVEVRVVASYWSPGPAYPGSSGISLVLILENFDYVSLYDGVARLRSGVTVPGELSVTNVVVGSLSRTTLVFRGLSVPRTVSPGDYWLELELDTLVDSGAVYAASMWFRVPVRIEEPPSPRLEVVSYGWADGRAFGHSVGNALRVVIRNSDPSVTVRSLRASLDLPGCFEIGSLEREAVVSAVLAYGSSATLEFSGIDVLCRGGTYRANLTVEVLGEISGSAFWQTLRYGLPLVVEEPSLNVEVADAGWVSRVAYPNSSRLTPYVVLVSYTRDSLASVVAYVRPVNARLSDGGEEAAVALGGPVSYGSSLTIRLPSVEVEGVADSVELELRVEALARYGRTHYNASRTLRVRLPLVTEKNVALAHSHVEYMGSPSPLLPTARGVEVRILLVNLRPEPLSLSGVRADAPRGFRVLGIGGDCPRVTLTAGGTCSLGLTLEVSGDVEPATYELSVGIEYVKSSSGASLFGAEVFRIPVVVEPASEYVPEVVVLEAYWGLERPTAVFPRSRNVPLTVVLQNLGRYDAVGVTVSVESDALVPVVGSAACSTRLLPGSTCASVLYLDVPAGVEGYVEASVMLSYHMSSFGAFVQVSRSYVLRMYVEPLEQYGGTLTPLSWGWANNYNVFPETENATLVVSIANRFPHSVAGVLAELYLPEGFRGERGRVSVAYVDGPLRSLSTTPLGFRVSVGRVPPGSYTAVLRLDYVVLSGGPGVRLVEEHEVGILVVDDRHAVELVSSSWLEGSVEPGTYGVFLHLVVRNNLVDGMSGVFLQLDLPHGIYSSLDNSSTVRVPPLSRQFVESLLALGTSAAGRLPIAVLEQLLQQAGTPAATYRRGDLVEFVVPLNLLVDSTGRYAANATLHYIDGWGTPRRCGFTVELAVLGSVRYVEVYVDGGTVRVTSRFTRATLALRNFGSSPAYNVYVAVYPYSQLPVLVASPTVHYVDRVEPGREVELELTLAYNPMGVYAVAGAQTVVSYGTVPLVVAVVYRDASGRLKAFNTTVVVVVEPFIDLVLREQRAVLVAGTVRVSGVLVNYGSATAYRVGVRACAGEGACAESFVGDVEPGAQRAFSVNVAVGSAATGEVGLTVLYYNAYNELQQLELGLPVTVAAPQTPTTPPAEHALVAERWVPLAVVGVFLAAVAYAIYRLASSYRERLRKASEVVPP